jgi:hypothetical protein
MAFTLLDLNKSFKQWNFLIGHQHCLQLAQRFLDDTQSDPVIGPD